MRIMVVGSGAREHAIVWAFAQSNRVKEIFCTPGNAGISAIARCVDLDFQEIGQFCRDQGIDLAVVGPEQPLADGLVDRLEELGIRAFGPTRAASILESSKSFTKEFCDRHNIPTAGYRTFSSDQPEQCDRYLHGQKYPLVIKADGLAAGKGVVIAHSLLEAQAAVRSFFDGRFGQAGQTLVIEEFLVGTEASLFVVSDGKNAQFLGTAQDHKRAFDGDLGPNTGGMGAFSPASNLDQGSIDQAMKTIINPTLAGMTREGRIFRGVLYAGLMITKSGPKLIEYNVRFGDPESQVILPRLQTGLLEIIEACLNGTLRDLTVDWSAESCLTVVMASKGYPGKVEHGTQIKLDPSLQTHSDVWLFHASTLFDDEGNLRANGGRVISLSARGENLHTARRKAYDAIGSVDWPSGFYRTDIGDQSKSV